MSTAVSLSPFKCSETSTEKKGLLIATSWMGPAVTMWVCPPGPSGKLPGLCYGSTGHVLLVSVCWFMKLANYFKFLGKWNRRTDIKSCFLQSSLVQQWLPSSSNSWFAFLSKASKPVRLIVKI